MDRSQYGWESILPSSVREKLTLVVDLDDPDVWAQCLHNRVEFFEKDMPMAMENLSIAQHRDTLRYARIRSGAYRPHCGDSPREIMFICNVRHLRHLMTCLTPLLLTLPSGGWICPPCRKSSNHVLRRDQN